MTSDLYTEFRVRRQEKKLQRVGLALIVIGVIVFGFSLAYGINLMG